MSPNVLVFYSLDLLAFAALAAAIAAIAARRVQRKYPGHRVHRTTWLTCGVIFMTGALVGEWCASVLPARIACLVAATVALAAYLMRHTTTQALREEIDQRDALLVRLKREKDAAEVASRAKSEFLAIMSHEIRTPLTAVVGFANVLSETRLTSTQQRYVDTIANAGERLADLVNDILDFSKIEQGKMTIERVPFSPALIVHEVIDLLAPKAAAKGLTMHFDNQIGNAITVVGDPTRVRQVLLNLVSNALKFTDKGTITVFGHWTLSAQDARSGRIGFQVIDTGIGIPPAKLGRLFAMYSQGDTATCRKFGGSGLGLAICKRLVELMGGTIQVTSMEGRGSTFTFEVPAELARELPETDSNNPLEGTVAPFQPEKRVLVVDDHELNRELLRLLLRRCGYDSDLAATGDDAIRMVNQKTYAAVFMDLEMPGMDGYSTTTAIRKNEVPGRRIPIVAVTAITSKGTRERCLASGMDEYLTKPVYVPAMKSTLKAVFERNGVAVP